MSVQLVDLRRSHVARCCSSATTRWVPHSLLGSSKSMLGHHKGAHWANSASTAQCTESTKRGRIRCPTSTTRVPPPVPPLVQAADQAPRSRSHRSPSSSAHHPAAAAAKQPPPVKAGRRLGRHPCPQLLLCCGLSAPQGLSGDPAACAAAALAMSAAAAAVPPLGLAALPDGVLEQVLGRLDLETRLTAAALVCKRWRELSVAPGQLQVVEALLDGVGLPVSQQRIQCFRWWLTIRAAPHVRRLHIVLRTSYSGWLLHVAEAELSGLLARLGAALAAVGGHRKLLDLSLTMKVDGPFVQATWPLQRTGPAAWPCALSGSLRRLRLELDPIQLDVEAPLQASSQACLLSRMRDRRARACSSAADNRHATSDPPPLALLDRRRSCLLWRTSSCSPCFSGWGGASPSLPPSRSWSSAAPPMIRSSLRCRCVVGCCWAARAFVLALLQLPAHALHTSFAFPTLHGSQHGTAPPLPLALVAGRSHATGRPEIGRVPASP